MGDANGARSLLHEAADEGYIAARNALSTSPHGMKRRVPLAITFCSPNAARVGKGFSALEGQDYLIGARDFSNQGRARMAETAQGLIRIYAAPETGRLLGAELAAPEGEHLAHLLALALHQEMDVRAMLRMPFYHPVLEEGARCYEKDTHYSAIGRVLVAQSQRSSGLGKELVSHAIACCRTHWPTRDIYIGAQTYLLNFYRSFGFECVGEEYLEDGIPHQDMILKQ